MSRISSSPGGIPTRAPAPARGRVQSAALFPPTLLTLVSNGQLYEHMLLEILAGIATYLLLRRISIDRWAAAAAGIAFALNGTFAWLWHATVNPSRSCRCCCSGSSSPTSGRSSAAVAAGG